MTTTVGSLVFSLEQISESLLGEFMPLLSEHYLEIAHYKDIPLDPDWDRYRAIAAAGALRIFTARDSGKLIVYSIFFVQRNPHYKTSLSAINDIIFIAKERRGFGRRFIAWCDEQLREIGVQVVVHHIKAAHDWSPMLERMGYDFQDKIMTRRLDH